MQIYYYKPMNMLKKKFLSGTCWKIEHTDTISEQNIQYLYFPMRTWLYNKTVFDRIVYSIAIYVSIISCNE